VSNVALATGVGFASGYIGGDGIKRSWE